MNAESVFNDFGINAIEGTQIMDSLGVNMSDLHIPQRLSRLHDVISYLKQFPEDTRRFLVSKAVRNKNVNKLDHMLEYIHILKEKESYETQLKDIEKELSVFDPEVDYMKVAELRLSENQFRQSLQTIEAEKEIYER